jgi:hypothetical protein
MAVRWGSRVSKVLDFLNGCCCCGDCTGDMRHCGDCGLRYHAGDVGLRSGNAAGDRERWSTTTQSRHVGVIKRDGGCGARCDDGRMTMMGGCMRTGNGPWRRRPLSYSTSSTCLSVSRAGVGNVMLCFRSRRSISSYSVISPSWVAVGSGNTS